MTVKLKVGSFDVLDTGVVNSHNDLPVEFHLTHKSENIICRMVFSEREKDEDGKYISNRHSKVISPNELEFNLSDWKIPTGVALPDPLDIGSIGGRELHLLIRIYGNNANDSRMISYTWLLGGTSDAG